MRKIWYAISHHSGAASTAAAIVWERVKRVSAEIMRMIIGTRTTTTCNSLGAPGSGINLPCKASVQTKVSHRINAAATAVHPSKRCREPRLLQQRSDDGSVDSSQPEGFRQLRIHDSRHSRKPVARPAKCHLTFAWLIRQKYRLLMSVTTFVCSRMMFLNEQIDW